MPFTFKLSQRLARIRRQGPGAPTVAPAMLTTAAIDSSTSTASRLAVSPNLLTLKQSQAANLILSGAVELLYERSPKGERERTIEVGELNGALMSPYLTGRAVGRCGRDTRNTRINNVLRDCGMWARRVPASLLVGTT